MSNPFEAEHGAYTVLVNAEGQHSLFPERAARVPKGWRPVFTGSRQACTDHIGENWTDMRPQSPARPS
ncbi:MbtH family protein [Streptomyces sp. S07_1.15]|uniref:MbtH family protein n=1 Tax=Streptomyces sp. S07_1.15 TaxID=2873925 RepID=UPI001D14FFE3|nr:MbtH family NRPS accessory protein [Streptomyces sp. S07_1.15]MCC3650543.1 MbtH family protein [Streptomyces sp. S07_1.15]